MVTDMINSGITEPQINIKKYVMIPPPLVWVGHCRSWVPVCCYSSCGRWQNLSSEGWVSWSNLEGNKNPLDDHAVESILRHCSECPPEVSGTIYRSERPLACAGSHYESAPFWPASQEQFIPFSARQGVLCFSTCTISSQTGSLVKMDPVSWTQVHCNKPAVFAP